MCIKNTYYAYLLKKQKPCILQNNLFFESEVLSYNIISRSHSTRSSAVGVLDGVGKYNLGADLPVGAMVAVGH